MLRDLLGRLLPPLTAEQKLNAAMRCIRVSDSLSASSIAALLEESGAASVDDFGAELVEDEAETYLPTIYVG